MIELKSRYKDVETTIDNNGFVTTSSYIREIRNQDGSIFAIDFDGGPFLEVGQILNGKPIKGIITKYQIIWNNE